jgi:mannosidase alpha-like ER degradation enhancer 1
MGTQKQFENAVKLVIDKVEFNNDNKVQVFEVNIRVLGGLVSLLWNNRWYFLLNKV